MNDLSKFDKKLEDEEIKDSIFHSLQDAFKLGVQEMRETTQKLFASPDGGQNQIDQSLDQFEDNVISNRKSRSQS